MSGIRATGFRFVNSTAFDREWSRLGLGDDQLRALQLRLMFDPESGDVISGTGGLRKMRWAIRPGQGKSGGARICYAFFRRHGIIYLVLVYAKADQANIAPAKKPLIERELKLFQSAIEKGLL